jgi:hypothetical protein
MNTVLAQECIRYNSLLAVMDNLQLRQVFKGLVVMFRARSDLKR